MKDSTRAKVACIVGAAANDKNISSVYDYSKSRHRTASVKAKPGSVQGYDYETGTHFSGSGGSGSFDFYDYETSAHVQLNLEGNRFSGYDYHSGKHFNGTVNGSSISFTTMKPASTTTTASD